MPLLVRNSRVEERWEGAAGRRIDARLVAMVLAMIAVFAGFYVLGRASGKHTAPAVEVPRAAVVGAGATIPLSLSSAPPLDTGVVVAPKPRHVTPPAPAIATPAPTAPAPVHVTETPPAATAAPVQASPPAPPASTPSPPASSPQPAPSSGHSSPPSRSSGGEGGGSFELSG
jgi:hypothetical protein